MDTVALLESRWRAAAYAQFAFTLVNGNLTLNEAGWWQRIQRAKRANRGEVGGGIRDPDFARARRRRPERVAEYEVFVRWKDVCPVSVFMEAPQLQRFQHVLVANEVVVLQHASRVLIGFLPGAGRFDFQSRTQAPSLSRAASVHFRRAAEES